MSNTSTLIAELSVGVGIAAILACSTINALAQEGSTYKTIELQVGDKSYPISYHFSNGATINGITIYPKDTTLRINLTASSDGNLEISIPREVSDAVSFTVATPSTLVLFANAEYVAEIPLTRSCEQTSFIFPVKADYRQIDLVGTIIMEAHYGYPLDIEQMKTFEEAGQNFTIDIITDAKKCDASFSKEEKKIHLDIKGRDEVNTTEHGFFAIAISPALLDGNYSVLVDGKTVSFKEPLWNAPGNTDLFHGTSPDTRYLQFNYTKDSTKIDILGTTAIPEFNTIVPMVTAISISTVVFILHRVQRTI